MSIPSHPLKPFSLSIGLNRLYEARSFNIKPFSERAKAVLNDAHLNYINIQQNNILALPPWDFQIFNYHNPFSGYDKAGTADVIYQQLFSFHRSKYSKYIPVYTDGSKTAGHVGCGIVFNNSILSFSFHNSMSVFSAELTAIHVALQHIIVSNHRHFCVYTDSMSALESLHFLTQHGHPTVIEVLILLRELERKGFDIIFPGYLDTWVYLENNIFALPPWDFQIFNYHNTFSGYDKAGTADVIYHQLFSFHRIKYCKYIPVYTDRSKTAGHVRCSVVFNNSILSFSLQNSMSVFSAELTAILVALQHILISNHRQFCVYTDSMSALESLHFLTEHGHPTVIEVLILLRELKRKGFDIIFSWVPGHVGILGNEQADNAARSMSDPMQQPVCYQDLKTSIQHYVHHIWQETWDQQILNKLHSIHSSTSHWAALPVRRHDVRLTRFRIGLTRLTHRHLLLGENAPECPSCKPFGLNSAPEEFQKAIDEVYEEDEDINPYFDDIALDSSTVEEHCRLLRRKLLKARKTNLKFNVLKMQLSQTSVNYLGHVLCPMKELNQIPRKLEPLKSLQHLTAKISRYDSVWICDTNTERDFELVKQRPCLKYFDGNKAVTVSVDTSKNGLGAVLLQEGQPVAYGSVSLTQTQQRYAQIEEGLMAVIYGLERFNYYTYRRIVTVQTDHKPILSLSKKPYDTISPRLQRMLFRLNKYNIQLQYVPRKNLIIANAISRAQSTTDNFDEVLGQEATVRINLLTQASPTKWEEIASLTAGKEHLLMIDYLSKYVELKPLNSTTAQSVITVMKSIYATSYGISEELVSDGGPPYNSNLMMNFFREWGIKHHVTSPYFPRVNGQIERAVQTVKHSLTKAAEEGKDWYVVLLDYRIQPAKGMPSPAELLMGRKLRTFLPSHPGELKPTFDVERERKALRKRQIIPNKYANKHATV
ncbi:retrovirus-related Pol polyprotein from transposon 17.6 [Trichonephila clavipes]|nr:retrovirus-related Pol polyprotein from transposon 17.6 [Trichonephila clavipes]